MTIFASNLQIFWDWHKIMLYLNARISKPFLRPKKLGICPQNGITLVAGHYYLLGHG